MEDNAQSPIMERPGAFGNGSTLQQSQHTRQQQQVRSDLGARDKGNSAKSSSSFDRLPRNVIERYVVWPFFLQ